MMGQISPEEFNSLVKMEEVLASLSVQLVQLAEKSGLSGPDLAEKMGCEESELEDLLQGPAYKQTLENCARLTWACGYRLNVNLERR